MTWQTWRSQPGKLGSTPPPRNWWLIAAFIVWCAVIGRMTLDPVLGDESAFGIVERVIAWLNERGIGVTYLFVEAVANIFMFIPFGFLLLALAPRLRWWRVTAIGAATSICIELTQLFFLPERYATVQDVVMNTLGALIGALVMGLFISRKQRPLQPPPHPDI